MISLRSFIKKKNKRNREGLRRISFNNGASYGQIVFLAGGAGSGKGHTISNYIDFGKFKLRDVDKWKQDFLKLNKLKRNFHSMAQPTVGAEAPKMADGLYNFFAQQIINKKQYNEIGGLDLRKPGDVLKLHMFVKDTNVQGKTFDFLKKGMKKDRLPNIIFDMTLKNLDNLFEVMPDLLNSGYEPKNIHLVWVLANYHIAVKRNKSRSRIVADDILLQTHEGAASTMMDIIKKKIPDGIDGDIRVVLASEKAVPIFDRDGKMLYKDGKPITMKHLPHIWLKKAGMPYMPAQFALLQLKNWVINNIPRSEATKHLFT